MARSTRRVRVRVTGVKELQYWLGVAKRRSIDLHPVLDGPIDKSLTEFFDEQFRTRGMAGNEPWAPLRPATISKKVKQGSVEGPDYPLVQHGKLRRAYTGQGPHQLKKVTRRSLERGVKHRWAMLHQTGYTLKRWGNVVFKKPRKVPARRVVPTRFPNWLLVKWENLLANYIMGSNR